MLDPFPFGGGHTSYEALALGLPVVTLPGRFLRGRLTHGMYQQMGYSDLEAQSIDDYVRLALRLAPTRAKENKLGIQFSNPATSCTTTERSSTTWRIYGKPRQRTLAKTD
jgi:predicted O-linked N-acetylglucosamine transferase (SPINDLY family)